MIVGARRGIARRAATFAIAHALIGGALLATSSASAHLGHVVLRAERYLKLDATGDDTRLVVSLMLGAEEGERVLADADADGDRRVTQAEADAYLAQWSAGLREELPVTIDGEPVGVAWGEGWLEPIGRVRSVPLTVELVAHLPSEAREHVVVFEDRMVRRETFDRTDVAFRAHDGAELVACGADAIPERCDAPELALVRGAPQPTTFAARVRYPERAERWPWSVVALSGVLSLLGGGALAWRARRRG